MDWPEVDPKTKELLAVQYKRAEVSIEQGDWDTLLHGTLEQARVPLKLSALELFDNGAERSGEASAAGSSEGQPVAGAILANLF